MNDEDDCSAANLREEPAAQLSEQLPAFGADLARLVAGEASPLNATFHGRSCGDPRADILAEVSSRRVEDDGTFPGPGPVHMVSVMVAAESPERDRESEVSLAEAIAWTNALLPQIEKFYLREDPDAGPVTRAPQWWFNAFLGADGIPVSAPPDFDWVSHRLRYRGLLVTLIDRDGHRIETIYENQRFPRHYHPYTESRGRYWDIQVSKPPTAASISRCFEPLCHAVARRAAIAENLRPVSLKWKHHNVIELALHDDEADCRYELELGVPTDEELHSGSYHFPRGGIAITDPIQYANGQVARLREIGVKGIQLPDSD